MKITTKKINGCKVTLIAGVRYSARRPAAARGQKIFPVTIRPTCDFHGTEDALAVRVEGLSYDGANAFMKKFNDSEGGRVW